MGAKRHQAEGDEQEIILGAGLPVAAMDEDMHRRRARIGEEDIQDLVGGWAESDVAPARKALQRFLICGLPCGEIALMIRVAGAIVVLRVEGRLIVAAKHWCAGHAAAPLVAMMR